LKKLIRGFISIKLEILFNELSFCHSFPSYPEGVKLMLLVGLCYRNQVSIIFNKTFTCVVYKLGPFFKKVKT